MKHPFAPPSRRRGLILAITAAALLESTLLVNAANTWDGGGTDGKWSRLLNWDDDLLPTFGSGVIFAGATNLLTNNDLTALTVGGLTFDPTADAFTLGGNAITLNGNITNNAAAAQTINLPIALAAATTMNVASGGTLTVGPGASGAGIISGNFGLTKTGLGTLNLGAANTYTGITTLEGGTVVYTATNTVGALNFGIVPTAAGVSTITSALDLTNASLTASSMAVQTNSGIPNTISIGNGNALAVNGAVTVAVGNVYTDLFAGVSTNLTVTGLGTLAVNGGAGHFTVTLPRTNAASGADPNATVDLSGLSHFIYTATSGELRVGAGNAPATMRLANTSNTITAAQIRVADTSLGTGDNGATASLFLGAGTNDIRANNIIVGMRKGTGNFTFQGPTGSISIAGQAGGASVANITVGDASSATGGGASQFLLAGHTATVQAGILRIGQLANSSGGNTSGRVTFDTGTFNVSSLRLATHSAGGAPNGITGTFELGGSFPNETATGVLNVGEFLLVNRTIATGTQANGTFTINGGTANIDADILIVDNSTTGAARSTTLTLAAGRLNMMGHAIGTVALPINNVNLPSLGQTATLANLGGTGINGAGLSFTHGGTLILAGTNTYTGPTTITGGTLKVVTEVGSGTLGSGNVVNDGVLVIEGPGTLNIAGGISGSGTFQKLGTGSTTIAGTSSYTNTTAIDAGTLSLIGSVGQITVAAGASLRTGYGGVAGNLAATSLAVDGGGLFFDFAAAGPLISVAGPATFTGASTLTPNVGVAAGTYTLLAANTLTLTMMPTLIAPVGTRKTFVADYATPNAIKLVVTGASKALQWSGAINSTWDVGAAGAQNWRDGALNETFFQADAVSFLDGPANRSVTITGVTVSPASIVVENSVGNDYTISGSGAIGGTAALVKNGAGAVSLAAANTYTGGTTLNAGTINIHHPTALGTGPLVIAGGSLGNASGAPVVMSANNPQAWNADFTFAGPDPLNLGGGTVTLGADRTITVAASALTAGGPIQGAFALTKAGAGTLIIGGISGATVTTIAAGTLQVGNGGSGGSLGAGPINNEGVLRFNRSSDLTVANTISGAGDLIQAGASILTLAGTNAYTGATMITAGKIRVTANTSLGALSNDVVVSPGAAFDLSGNPTAQALNFGSKHFKIAGAGPDGLGAIVNFGVSQFNALQQVTLTADATVGGTARFDIRSVPTSALNAKLDLAGHTLTKTGGNEFTIVGTDVTDGDIIVNQGTFGIESVSNVPDFLTGKKIVMNAGTALKFFNNTSPISTVLRPIVFNGPGSQIGNNNNANSIIGSPITLNGDVTAVTFNNNVANTLTLTGSIGETTPHSLTKNGVGTLVLAGNNTYSGGTILNVGTLGLNHPSALGTGPLVIVGGSLSNPSGGPLTITANNPQMWNADFAFIGTSALNLGTGAVTLGGNRVVTINDSELAVGGAIGGAFALTKAGPGRLVLNGASAYSGGTIVDAGALIVNGSVSGAFSLNGGILGGNGTVGVVTLAGGILAPGNSPGILTTGNLVLNAGSLAIEFDGQEPGQGPGFNDQVNVTGTVTFGAPITLTLDFSGYDPVDAEDHFTILNNDGADAIIFANAAARLVYDGITLNEGDIFTAVSGPNSQLFSITYGGGASQNDVVLHAIPEPGAAVALLGGLGVLAAFRFRRS
jgi:fibronectin-binding autotransporter adhesin